MKLIGSLASPYVRKVRVVLAEKKLDYQIQLENVWSADTSIHLVNPLGKVPCLVMEDGCVMYDSRVIVEYLDTLTPVCKLLPQNGRERADVKNWEALADGVVDAAAAVRAERTQRPAGLQSEPAIERQLAKVTRGLASLSERLSDAPWCAGNHYSLADVAAGCTLGWLSFRFPEIDWRTPHPNLARLYDRLHERPSFRDTVPQA
ncbi:glutathione S-transferase [Massilia dura]|uniref:Glutathione S-transferase n=1 Tax=Pseudoduganella dura TaxID=321982 RepID=A0A6I3XPX2_9BURK|nr:glutathione S-transferase C-terminal domain-containing protein [Pseudoduganella dura]MUI13865.1 glutathione S-transferase [Pseudoduganella dura]GGY11391.1 glutathione S-transferase [Pseudoduganella dura]